MLKARFGLTELVGKHGFQLRHGGTPSPQPNSGLPEFGHSMTWPKSETSDFGWGEGGGEGEPISRSFVTPSPHPSPLRGEGAGRICGSVVPSICVKRNPGHLIRGAKSASLCLATLVLCAVAIVAAHAEQRVPGLTGIDRASDVVQARQILMSQIDEEMQPVDLVAGGKDLSLDDLKANAYRINTMLAAFPHLFPPQTKPSTGPDSLPTSSAPEVWEDFDAFYSLSEAATKIAYEASQATTIDQFRENAKKLRAACDGCHGKYMKVQSPSPP